MSEETRIKWPQDKNDLNKIFVDAEARGDHNVKTLAAVALALLEASDKRVDTMNTLLDYVLEITAAYKRLGLLLKADTIVQLEDMTKTLLGMDTEGLLAEEIEVKTLQDQRVRMTVRGSHWGMKAVARNLGPSLRRADGEYWSNLEWVTTTPEVGEVVVTLQRKSGKTKGQLLNEAEARVTKLRVAAEAALKSCGCGTLRPVDPSLNCEPCTLLRQVLAETAGETPKKDDVLVVGSEK